MEPNILTFAFKYRQKDGKKTACENHFALVSRVIVEDPDVKKPGMARICTWIHRLSQFTFQDPQDKLRPVTLFLANFDPASVLNIPKKELLSPKLLKL